MHLLQERMQQAHAAECEAAAQAAEAALQAAQQRAARAAEEKAAARAETASARAIAAEDARITEVRSVLPLALGLWCRQDSLVRS